MVRLVLKVSTRRQADSDLSLCRQQAGANHASPASICSLERLWKVLKPKYVTRLAFVSVLGVVELRLNVLRI